MKLRTSLALRLLVLVVPLYFGARYLRQEYLRDNEVDSLVQLTLDAMENGGRERCLRAPTRFGGPLIHLRERGLPAAEDHRTASIHLFAYDAKFISANGRAPSFPADMQAELTAGADRVHRFGGPGIGPPLRVGLRTGWSEEPCAFLLIERRDAAPGRPRRGEGRGETRPRPGSGRPDDVDSNASRASSEVIADVSPSRPRGRPDSLGQEIWGQAAVLALILIGAVVFATWPMLRRIHRLTTAVKKSAADGYLSAVPEMGRDELGALGRAFNDAGRSVRATIENLQTQEQALRNFLANTTHDVMHPLSVLQGHLSAMNEALERGAAPDPAIVRSCQEEAHFVASLVHNLTAAARLQSGVVPLDLRQHDLRTIVERAVARHAAFATSRGLSLDCAVPALPVAATCDLTLLEQAVSNLVHNAIRYNRTGKHVAVTLELGPADFLLTVLDDGPGVPPADLAHLTERRFRSDAAWRENPEGMGIGLTIVHEVVLRHGFRLELGPGIEGGFRAAIRGDLATDTSDSRKN